MASFRRQKEALRGALFAFVAGGHRVIEEVERAQSLTVSGGSPEAAESRHAMLEDDYERFLTSGQSIELFADILDEEDLYPFGSEWPREVFVMLLERVLPPKLSIDSGADEELRFRFKKGFKEMLADSAASVAGTQRQRSTLDHWLVLLLNTAFHAGATVAARIAESPKTYYAVLPEIEEETEPWSRYRQIADLFERQLKRETKRKTGLVSDFEDY